MADSQTIAIGIIQANALLLPVILLLVQFTVGLPSERGEIASYEKRLLKIAIPALVFLSVSGLLASIGILTLRIQELVLFGGVIFLILGFGGLSLFTGLTVWYASRPA